MVASVNDKEFNRRLRWVWVVIAGMYVVLAMVWWIEVQFGGVR